MPQAKVLTEKELKIVLATVAQGRHAARNRALILTSFWTGMRAVCGAGGVRLSALRLEADVCCECF